MSSWLGQVVWSNTNLNITVKVFILDVININQYTLSKNG